MPCMPAASDMLILFDIPQLLGGQGGLENILEGVDKAEGFACCVHAHNY